MRLLPFFITLLAASCGMTPVYAKYLTPAQISKIAANRPDYEYGAVRAGIPWLALAAIHVRESNLKRIPGNIGGAMMLDLGGKTGSEFERRIRSHEEKMARKYGYRYGASVEDDFRFSCLVAADEFRSKIRGKLYMWTGEVDEDVLANALWYYNGHAQKSWRYSPCVANNPQRGWVLEVRWKDKKGMVHSYMDTRPGTLVLWRELQSCTAFR